MGCDYELAVRKMFLQQLAELIAVTGVYGHYYVIQERECELLTIQALHEGKIQTNPHAVLMPLTVISSRWKEAALVKVNVEIELTLTRAQLCGEVDFVLFINLPVERAEFLLNIVV